MRDLATFCFRSVLPKNLEKWPSISKDVVKYFNR